MTLNRCILIMTLGTLAIAGAHATVGQNNDAQGAKSRWLEEPITTIQELNKVIEANVFAAYQKADTEAKAGRLATNFDELFAGGANQLRGFVYRTNGGGLQYVNTAKPDADQFNDVLDTQGTYMGERHSAGKIKARVDANDREGKRLLRGASTTGQGLNTAP